MSGGLLNGGGREWLRNAPGWVTAILAVGATAYYCAVQHYSVSENRARIADHELRLRTAEAEIASIKCEE